MTTKTLRQAASGPAKDRALQAERAQRAALARDDHLPPAKTSVMGLAAAGLIWAVVLVSLVLH
jgi:hypothetical protein